MIKFIAIWGNNLLQLILIKISVKQGLMVELATKEKVVIPIIYHQDKVNW